MNEKRLQILIEKYLAGTATKAENFIVESWLESFQLDDDGVSEDSQVLAQKIINQTLVAQKTSRAIPLWHKLSGIAAVFVLGALTYLFLKPVPAHHKVLSSTYIEYRTGINEFKELRLPDSTLVYLNANSILAVQQNFTKQTERRVKLNGEAFFDVKKDKVHPFKIEVGEVNVKVVGTSFNIQGHKSTNEIKVAVKTGIVQVNNEVALSANQQLVYHKVNKTYRTLNKEVGAAALWRTGVSVLDKASFDELSTVMFNVYGVTLKSDRKKVLSGRYNFTIRSTRTLNQSLNQLCELTKKRYRKEGSTIIIY